ncbi:hypothetical protein GGD64_007182 [Bradyrhizobium sp. CIR3A]|nr:hypothetical protein [Bradyrhizobium sp. CIR3A]
MHLAVFAGVLQADCYKAAVHLPKKTLPLCRRIALPTPGEAFSSWPTSRKMLGKARRESRSSPSHWRPSGLFEIEHDINGCDAKDGRALRQEQSKPLLDDMHA